MPQMMQLASQRLISNALSTCDIHDDETVWDNPKKVGDTITENDTCSLCDDTFKKENKPFALHCGHVYHSSCIRDHFTDKVDNYYQQNKRMLKKLDCPHCQSDALAGRADVVDLDDKSIWTKAVETISSIKDTIIQNTKPLASRAIEWVKNLPTTELPIYLTIGTILTMPFPIISITFMTSVASLMLANKVLNIDTISSQNQRIDEYKSPRMILTTLMCGLAAQGLLYTAFGVSAYFLPLLGTVGAIYGGIYAYENYVR